MYCQTKGMLQKARQPKHGGSKTILEFRKSLSEIGWTGEQIIQYDIIALEDHFFLQHQRKEIVPRKVGYSS